MKAVSLTSYKDRFYEYGVWITRTVLVVLMEDGTLWERPAGSSAEWKKLDTP